MQYYCEQNQSGKKIIEKPKWRVSKHFYCEGRNLEDQKAMAQVRQLAK